MVIKHLESISLENVSQESEYMATIFKKIISGIYLYFLITVYISLNIYFSIKSLISI